MDIKTLALTLGLPETADEAAVNAKLAELKQKNAEADSLRQENDSLKLAQITAAVDVLSPPRRFRQKRSSTSSIWARPWASTLSPPLSTPSLRHRNSAPPWRPPRLPTMPLRPVRGNCAWPKSARNSRNNNR